MNSCRANTELVTVYGVPRDQLLAFFPEIDVTEGSLDAFLQSDSQTLAGARVAERMGFGAGDQAEVAGISLSVAGVFTTGGLLDNVIIANLDHLAQSIPGGSLGDVTQFLVRPEPNADTDLIAANIDAMFERDREPTRTRPLAEHVFRTMHDLRQIVDFAQLLGYVAVAVMALVLANTVFMSAQTRRAEFGVLQVIGVTRAGTFLIVLSESILLALIGGAVGLLAVWGVLDMLDGGIGVEGYQVDFLMSARIAWEGLLLAAVMGLLAGIGPASQAATSPVVSSLRPE